MIPWVLVLFTIPLASPTFAQDSIPRPNTVHPETGEIGTWIPSWLEREHVLDDLKLKTCRVELEKVETTLQEARAAIENLQRGADDLTALVDETEARELALRERILKQDAKLERRARLAWVLSGTTLTAFGALGLLLWAP
jgi:hypothetical protein